MLEYIFAGLALGSIYAIASCGLVMTYVSAGILNFAFGSMAFFLARFYYFLHSEHGIPTLISLVLTLFAAGPALGFILWLVLFRHLRHSSQVIKIVCTIGLSVALPAVATLVFGNETITRAPGLAPDPVAVYQVFGASVTLDQIIVFAAVVVVVAAGVVVLRFTSTGLRVRALVDSGALTALSGVNSSLTSIGVWTISTSLAGLAGILIAPTSGLNVTGMTALMSAAFAAVLAARLRSLPMAALVSVAMGLITEIIQKYLPPDSSVTSAIIPSIPFVVIAVFLVLATLRKDGGRDSPTGGLDAAIRPHGAGDTGRQRSAPVVSARSGLSTALIGPVAVFLFVALLPLLLTGYWLTLLATGIAFGVVYLSYTLVTGEAGLIWLCQASFAGGGAIATAQLATINHWPVIPAILVAALLMVPIGAVIAILTVRLGDLYVALATLSFGLLVETLVFTRDRFYQGGIGVEVLRPDFLSTDRAFAYFALAIFLVLAIIVVNLRRSTTGMALSAVRWSEPGARTLGISVLRTKVIASAISTFVCGVGGGLLALNTSSATPASFGTYLGLAWLATVVTIGVRSLNAALVAGLSSTLLPGLVQTYLPTGFGDLPALLFGLGAILAARYPDGQVVESARRVEAAARRFARRYRRPPPPSEPHLDPPPRTATAVPSGEGRGS